MDAIMWLVIGLVSVWLAYSVASGERRGRLWDGMTALGVYLALFGGIYFGLNQVWNLLRPKLTDEFPGENTMLFVGLIILVALVVLALDLLGTVDVVSKARQSVGMTDAGRSNPGAGSSGDD